MTFAPWTVAVFFVTVALFVAWVYGEKKWSKPLIRIIIGVGFSLSLSASVTILLQVSFAAQMHYPMEALRRLGEGALNNQVELVTRELVTLIKDWEKVGPRDSVMMLYSRLQFRDAEENAEATSTGVYEH